MPLRNFKDSGGSNWRVWDVLPYGMRASERRTTSADRRVGPSSEYQGPERRGGRDRRKRNASLLTPGLEAGWLCFENHLDKRRLTPIPADWNEVDDGELEDLLARAHSVARRS